MPTITFRHKGNFEKSNKFLNKLKNREFYKSLESYGEKGVNALRSATPIGTGKTSQSWRYKIERRKTGVSIIWCNDNVNQGVNIALMLQYGHGDVSGGYVRGKNFIKPAIKPIFDEIEESVWKEVTKD